MRVQVGDTPTYATTGKPWGTVESMNVEDGTILVSMPDGATHTFGIYEVEAWLRDQVLLDGRHFCRQCGQDMGSEWFLGPVCGKCVRKNHRQACGR